MTVVDPTMAYMEAVRTVLLADSAIRAAGVLEVLDRARPNMKTPFITLGATSDLDWSTATEDGIQLRMDVSIWDSSPSQTPETRRSREIIARVRALLHTATLTLAPPAHHVLTRVTAVVGPMLDPDGFTLHSVVTVTALLDHT